MRRLIGLVSLYLACIAATNMGLQAGGTLQQSSSYGTADARIYGFFGILFAVIIVIDGAAQLANSQIELQAAGNPFGGTQLDATQQSIRDAVNGSHVAVPLVRAFGKPIVSVFQPVLPADPQIYFGPGPVNP